MGVHGTSWTLYGLKSSGCLQVGAPTSLLETFGLHEVVATYRDRTGSQYSGEEKLAHCLTVLEGFPAFLRQLVEQTPPSTVLEHGLWIIDPELMPEAPLATSLPVTCVGDAWHPMRPIGECANVRLRGSGGSWGCATCPLLVVLIKVLHLELVQVKVSTALWRMLLCWGAALPGTAL
jgi:hypothetical protein